MKKLVKLNKTPKSAYVDHSLCLLCIVFSYPFPIDLDEERTISVTVKVVLCRLLLRPAVSTSHAETHLQKVFPSLAENGRNGSYAQLTALLVQWRGAMPTPALCLLQRYCIFVLFWDFNNTSRNIADV